jgi:PAS domain S-box-containing protein
LGGCFAAVPAPARKSISSITRADYRLLVDSIRDYAIFMLDVEGRITSWNLGAEKLKGYQTDEILGEHFSIFYPPEEIAKLSPAEELEIAARDGRIELEGWRLRKDGSRFWANVVITALREADGTLRGFAKVTRDLSERRKAEEELRHSEERFRLLVEGVRDYAIYMLDPSGRITTWNAGAERLKGYTSSEIIGQHFSLFFSPEDVKAGKPVRELGIAETEGRFEEEGWRVRKDGARFRANVVVTALRDASGQLIGFAKVTRDLTAQLQAEEVARELVRQNAARAAAEANESALRASQARHEALSRWLEAILEGIPDGITVQDRSGTLLFANTAAARACGFPSVAELLASTPAQIVERFELSDERGEPIDPARLPGRQVLAGEPPRSLLARVKERATGRRWWSHIRSSAIPGPDGRPELAINVWHDVSAERRRELQERYLVEATTVLASSLDYETTLAAVAELLVPGFADYCAVHLLEGDVLRPITVAHADPDRAEQARELQLRYPPDPSSDQGLWKVMKSGESELVPVVTPEMIATAARDQEHARALGSLEIRSAMLVPIRIRQHAVGTISVVSEDPDRRYDAQDLALLEELSRRIANAVENARLYAAAQKSARRAEHALERAEEASRIKDEFLATVSHELRTPLQSIVGWSALLRERNREASLAKGIEVIHRNAQAQSKLVEDILDVSRIITGKLHLELETTDFMAVIRDAVEVVRASALAKRITIEVDARAEEHRLIADPARLQQVVWNLLSNAVKFTDPGGSVIVRLERAGSRLVLSVSDTGRGIEAEFLPYVFDRFKQADSTTTRRVGGLGLGLAIVRHIVELHGGQVHAASAGAGMGATFTISFPVRAVSTNTSDPPPRSVKAPLLPSAASLDGVRVLIVDDESDARELLEIVLCEAGATVATAQSSAEGLGRLIEFEPNVLISDVGMPEVDGHTFMRRVRSLDSAVGRIPAIALTAYTRGEDKAKALAAGFTMHVGKPVEPAELIAAVSRLSRSDSGVNAR